MKFIVQMTAWTEQKNTQTNDLRINQEILLGERLGMYVTKGRRRRRGKALQETIFVKYDRVDMKNIRRWYKTSIVPNNKSLSPPETQLHPKRISSSEFILRMHRVIFVFFCRDECCIQ